MNSNPMQQPVLDFGDVVAQRDSTLKDLKSLFESQGFAFLRFPGAKVKEDTMARLESCLIEQPATAGHRRDFGKLGFHDTSTKRSFSCLTGSELNSFLGKAWVYDDKIASESVRTLAMELDQHLLQLVEATSSRFFGGKSPQELGKELDIPFLDSGNETSASFALFDAALYKNDVDASAVEGGNCAAHYDPGLYSLWVGETQPGLKLKDGFGVWISPPTDSNVHVLWLGEAAKNANPKFVPALHLVDSGQALPRLSVWTELCTRKQVLSDDVAKFASAKVIEVKNGFKKDREPYRVRVENGNIQEAFRTIEEVLRMPFSKSIQVPIYDDDGFVTGTGEPWARKRAKNT